MCIFEYNLSMFKRKAPTIVTSVGEVPNPEYCEEDLGQENTPEEVKQRKFFRARRPLLVRRQIVIQPETTFKLSTSLVAPSLETQLLSVSMKSATLLSEEIRDNSPRKQHSFGAGAHNPLEGFDDVPEDEKMKKFMHSKKENDRNPQDLYEKRAREGEVLRKKPSEISVPVTFSINNLGKRQGFLQLTQFVHLRSTVKLIVFRNSIQQILYNAALATFSVFRPCPSSSASKIDLEITVYRNISGLCAEECRVSIAPQDKHLLCAALERLKTSN